MWKGDRNKEIIAGGYGVFHERSEVVHEIQVRISEMNNICRNWTLSVVSGYFISAHWLILNKETIGLTHASYKEDYWDVDLQVIGLYVKGIFAYDLFIQSRN